MGQIKSIHHTSFHRGWSAHHLTPVALAVTAVLMLADYEKSDGAVPLYQNANGCSTTNPGKSAEYTTTLNNTLRETEHATPRYTTREDYIAEFDENQCQQAPT